MTSKMQLLPADIGERIKTVPERIANVQGVVALWLFGSFARGEATALSDVDLAYLIDAGQSKESTDHIETELYLTIAHALHSDEFTFVNLQCAPAFFAWHVLSEGRLLCCKDARIVARLAEKVYGHAPDVQWLRAKGNADFLIGVGMPEPSIDKNRVIEFLRLISQDVKVVREKAQEPKQRYLGSPDLQAIVERRLQTAAESCINIGNHLIARLGLRAPKDYADVFAVLGEAQVLQPELVSQMREMAKFRNLLVHVYWEIDQERVFESLPTRLSGLDSFVQCIANWLKA